MTLPGAVDSGWERARICEALLALVAEQGYTPLTAALLRERAAIDQPTFERHFRDLDECFAAVWAMVHDELNDQMTAAFTSRDTWLESLRAALAAGMAFLADDQGIARLFLVEILFVERGQRQRLQEPIECLGAMIDRGRREAPEPGRLTASLADGSAGAIWRRVQGYVREGQALELPSKVPELMFLAVFPYLGLEAAEAELRRPLE